jgi:hypothetical protein
VRLQQSCTAASDQHGAAPQPIDKAASLQRLYDSLNSAIKSNYFRSRKKKSVAARFMDP